MDQTCHLYFILDKAQVYLDEVLEAGSRRLLSWCCLVAVGRQAFTAGQNNCVDYKTLRTQCG